MRIQFFKLKSVFGCLAMVLCLVGAAFGTFPGHNVLIAFQVQTDAGIQIYTVRPNGKDLRQITFLDGDAVAAAWSPDGRTIVFEHVNLLAFIYFRRVSPMSYTCHAQAIDG